MNGWDKVWNVWPDWCGLSTHMAVWPLPSPPQPPASPAGATAVLSPLHTQHLCPQSSVLYTLSTSVLSLQSSTHWAPLSSVLCPQSSAHLSSVLCHGAWLQAQDSGLLAWPLHPKKPCVVLHTLHSAQCTGHTAHCTPHYTLRTPHCTTPSDEDASLPLPPLPLAHLLPGSKCQVRVLQPDHPLLLLSHLTCPFSYSSVPNMWPFLNKATC